MRIERLHFLVILLLAIVVAAGPGSADDLRVSHLYNLSDFSGTIPYSYANLHADSGHDETYVVYQNVIRIFNASGMEVFQFGNSNEGGRILDVTVDDTGDIYTLSHGVGPDHAEIPFFVEQRNYRGESLAAILPAGLPSGWIEFAPSRIFHRAERLLLVDTSRLLAVETDLIGTVTRTHDLAAILDISGNDNLSVQISGFDWDARGNMLMTVPVAFRAYVVSPQGDVRGFGKGGSLPGTFGIVSGITGDENGLIYVADKLRNVVMIFGPDLGFLTEFGHRGLKPENLIAPNQVVIGDTGKVHVAQLRNRGVAVFAVRPGALADLDAKQARNRKEVPQHSDGFFQQELFSSPGDGRPVVNPDLQTAGALDGSPSGGG